MTLARTTVTIPTTLLAEVDKLCGPRGRSAFVAEAVEERVRRERLRQAIESSRGAVVGTGAWQPPTATYEWVRAQRRDRDEP